MSRFGPKYSPEFRQRLVDLHRSGRSIESLAREFKPRASTIAYWVHEYARDARQHAEGPTSAEQSRGCLCICVDGFPPSKGGYFSDPIFSPMRAPWHRANTARRLLEAAERALAGTQVPPFGKGERLGLALDIYSRGLRGLPVDFLGGVVDALTDRRRARAARRQIGMRRLFDRLLDLRVYPDDRMIREARVCLHSASKTEYVVKIWRLDPP